MQKMVKTAERIARRAHAGQVDKAGVPYAHHPAWVAARVEGDDAKAAAWLHDVLEDTSLTADDLRRAGIPEEVVHTVEVLTHAEGESYQDYLERVARPPLAAVSFSSRNPSAGRTVRVTVVPGSAAWQSVATAPFTIAATVMG